MRVILREDIQKLGEAGDIVTVKRGYARNYLIPNKLALEATEGNLKTFKDIARAQEARSEKEKGSAEIMAQKLAAVRLVIPVEVSDDDQLYGSVTTQMIRDALAADGIEIERRHIELPAPIKELGTFDVSVRLHREVAPTISVVVERTTDREAGSVDWEAAVDAEDAKEAAAEAAGSEEETVDEIEPEKAAEATEPEEEVDTVVEIEEDAAVEEEE
ncbi:50S ribosomal protein L9 [Gemmatimonadota bacterium]